MGEKLREFWYHRGRHKLLTVQNFVFCNWKLVRKITDKT